MLVTACLSRHRSYDVVERQSSEYNQSLCFPLIVLQHSYHDAMGSFPSEEDSEKMLLKIRCFVVDSMISIHLCRTEIEE